MGKWVANDVLDSALGVIASATRMVAVSGQPGSFPAAWANRLAEAPLAAGDFVIGGGSVSGRRIDVAAKEDVTIVASGTADHVALVDVAAEKLLYVTTCPAQLLSSGAVASFDSWSVEIGEPF